MVGWNIMRFEKSTIQILKNALGQMEKGFDYLPSVPQSYNLPAIAEIMQTVAHEMQDNYPYFHPYYAGQMLKPPHPVARAAYMLSLWINPNNHALDGGRASSRMEKEAVAEIAKLFQWDQHLGHLTGGGTLANTEALWIAGKLHPEKVVTASSQAHYTHKRMSEVLKLDYQAVTCDSGAKMDLTALKELLDSGKVGTVVATIGTTGTGSVDPLEQLVDLRKQYGFHLHADAAYGGYFILADNLRTDTRRAFDHLSEVDSIVIDPHKHGLQPYGCGCVLYQDPAIGRFYKHESPYTYFTSKDLHLGEISLECSRAGASAVALWASQQLLPMVHDGVFASQLTCCRDAALTLYQRLEEDDRFKTILAPELDIVIWTPNGSTISTISQRSQQLFHEAMKRHLYLATFKYPVSLLPESWSCVTMDQPFVTCLRSCLMKPEHLNWMDQIWNILDQSITELSND
jgi:glutamate/tyrosine decarboxylase-like PLP-dependent enzyme